MGTYTKIPSTAFEEMQLDAGILLNTFNPASPNVLDSHIICATTGGINASCVPTYEDIAEDVDNAPTNLKEYKKLTGWESKISTTALGTSADMIKLALGAGTKSGAEYAVTNDTTVTEGKTYYTRSGSSPNYVYAPVAEPASNPKTAGYYEATSPDYKVVPNRDLNIETDFADIWWVGDRADGGFVAIKLINALSTGGFSLQTTKNGKGQFALEFTGHVSSSAQDVMPMEFYSVEA